MNISQTFIERPIATSLLMAAIALFGAVAYRSLPVSDLPNVDFPDPAGDRQPARARARRPWPPPWPRRSKISSRPSPA